MTIVQKDQASPRSVNFLQMYHPHFLTHIAGTEEFVKNLSKMIHIVMSSNATIMKGRYRFIKSLLRF